MNQPEEQVEIFIIGLDEQVPRSFWAVLVKRRANYICEKCGNQKDLVSHHLDSNKENNCLRNGQCLCRGCHMKAHWADEEHKESRSIAISEALLSVNKNKRFGYEGWMNKTPEERSNTVRKGWETRKALQELGGI